MAGAPSAHGSPAHVAAPAGEPAATLSDPVTGLFEGQLSLGEVGYPGGIRLMGPLSEVTLTFALPAEAVPPGELKLSFEASPVLQARSAVTVSIQGGASVTIRGLGATTTSTLPVALERDHTFLVHIIAGLSEGIPGCPTAPIAGVCAAGVDDWVIIGQGSCLAYHLRPPGSSARAFLRYPAGTIVMHGLWDSPAHSSASINLFSTLQHENRYGPTRVVLGEDATVDEPQPVREVFVTPSKSPLAELIDGKLYVPATPRALAAVRAMAGEPVAARPTEYSAQGQAGRQEANDPYRLLLTQTGAPIGEAAGDGGIIRHIRFTQADLGGWPADPTLHLVDALPATTYLTKEMLAVSLNGVPVGATDLDRPSDSLAFAIPAFALNADNDLEIELRPTGPRGGSGLAHQSTGIGPGPMYLTWTKYGPWRGIWPEVLNRLQGQGQIYFMDGSAEMALAAARLLGGLSRLAPSALVPELEADPGLAAPGSYRILVGGASAIPGMGSAALDLARGIEILNPADKTQLVHSGAGQPAGAVQYFSQPEPTLVLQRGPDGNVSQLDAAITALTYPSRFYELAGNTMLGLQDMPIALELGPGALQQRDPAGWSWRDALSKGRWLLLPPLALLVALGAAAVYRRMGQPARLPPEP